MNRLPNRLLQQVKVGVRPKSVPVRVAEGILVSGAVEVHTRKLVKVTSVGEESDQWQSRKQAQVLTHGLLLTAASDNLVGNSVA